MRSSRLSYAFLTAFLVSVFFLQWWTRNTYLFLILGLLGFSAIAVCFRVRLRLVLPLTVSGLIGISLATFIVVRTTHTPSPRTADFYADGSKVAIRGMIADDPDKRPMQNRYVVETEFLKTAAGTMKVSGRVLVTAREEVTPLSYGDVIVAEGPLTLPEPIEDFAYDKYLSLSRVYSLMRNAKVEPTGRNTGNAVVRRLFILRHAVEARINALLPEPHASLLAGLLIGSRRGIPEDLTQDFKTTGLTHLVAISGTNITMIVTTMGVLFFWLPLRLRFLPSVLLISMFTLLTGASASAVRAAVMGVLGLLALQLGRLQTTRLTMLWTAFIMIAWNPSVLWYDAGFQLSYLALIGLVEIAPLLRPYLTWLPAIFGIRESLCLTLSAQILAASWIFFLFGQLSLIAPLSNLLAPPLVPAAMLFGTLSVLFHLVSHGLGLVTAALAWLPLSWIIGVAEVLSSLPYAAVQAEKFGTIWIVLYYAGIAGWILMSSRKTVKAV